MTARDDNPAHGYREDPVGFVKHMLGEEPYDKQEDILRAVHRSRRVSVVGCNSSGKDWAAARAVLWWMYARSPAKVVVTGPSTRQVDDILWREMRWAYGRAAEELGGRMFRTSKYELDEQSFAIGFATNSPYNLQGFHSPNLMAVVTEAHAARENDIDAVRRLNPSRLLMTGNPFTASGAFYDSHHGRRRQYETIQIGAFDTPNVKLKRVVTPGMITIDDVEARAEEWEEHSPLYVGAVLGRFPEKLDDVIVSRKDAAEAAARVLTPTGPVIVGCDVARFGRDKTVVVSRQGPVARIVWKSRGSDTMSVASYLMSYCEENQVDSLVVDETGVGAGVVDRLKELRPGCRVVPFNGARRAHNKERFPNRITEVWTAMAERYASGEIDTDDDPALIEQVSGRRCKVGKDGLTHLQSKENMHRSPDEADALAMTFAVRRGGYRNTIWV